MKQRIITAIIMLAVFVPVLLFSHTVVFTIVASAMSVLAVYEMLFEDKIPNSVSINEAVELTKKFDDPKAKAFVNGVLNSVKNEIEGNGEKND